MSSGVEFEEDSFGASSSQPQFRSTNPSQSASASYSGNEGTGMAGWLIRHRLAKSAKGAQYILLGVVAINFIISIIAVIHFI